MKSEQPLVERLIGAASANQPAASPLIHLLRDSQQGLENLFRQHYLSPHEAEDVLREVLRTLVWKWETVRNRKAWLLAVVERRCASRTSGTPAP